MKKVMTIFVAILFASVILSSCTTVNKAMKEPNVRVELESDDFTLSDQVSAEAKSTTILGIDFARIFKKETGTVESSGSAAISVASVPVIGTVLEDKTSNYALYDLMNNNEGYDVVFYPQYEKKVVKPILGIGFLTTITTVKATARLGKLKN